MKYERRISIQECADAIGVSQNEIRMIIIGAGINTIPRKSPKYFGRKFIKVLKLSEVKAALEKRRNESALIKDLRATATFMIRRKYGMGKWETLKAGQFPQLPAHASMKTIAEIEQHLNNGLLFDQAEAAYPRMGMHSHAIYKVSPIYKKTSP